MSRSTLSLSPLSPGLRPWLRRLRKEGRGHALHTQSSRRCAYRPQAWSPRKSCRIRCRRPRNAPSRFSFPLSPSTDFSSEQDPRRPLNTSFFARSYSLVFPGSGVGCRYSPSCREGFSPKETGLPLNNVLGNSVAASKDSFMLRRAILLAILFFDVLLLLLKIKAPRLGTLKVVRESCVLVSNRLLDLLLGGVESIS